MYTTDLMYIYSLGVDVQLRSHTPRPGTERIRLRWLSESLEHPSFDVLFSWLVLCQLASKVSQYLKI